VNEPRPRRRPTAEIDMSVDLAAEPIEGVLRHRHGADKPFTGWTALVRAVELALEDERRQLDPSQSG
jgi:hypothetical protein